MGRIERSRAMDAPAPLVWDVMTDPGVYADVAPNLAEVTLLSDPGPDMERRCVDTDGNVWTETCTRWEDGRAFAVAVEVATSDFHRRWFSRFEGSWTCDDRTDDVLVTIAFEFETRYGPVGWLVAKGLEWSGASIIDAIFDGWEDEIRARPASTDGRDTTEAGYRRPEVTDT